MGISGIDQAAPDWRKYYIAEKTPDTAFYSHFKAAYQDYRSATAAHADTPSCQLSLGNLSAVFGELYTAKAEQIGMAQDELASFADILNRAYSSNAMSDPKAFLKSLSPAELGVVQKTHLLADTIDIDALSLEGAGNLLLPAGYSLDLNHDYMDEVGAAHMIHFPPRDAPEEFRVAWAKTLAGLDERDAMTYTLTMYTSVIGAHFDGLPHPESDHPTNRIESYQQVVQDALDSIDERRAYMAEGQYERELAFYKRLQSFLPPTQLFSRSNNQVDSHYKAVSAKPTC
ncbi:MAG: hypothetical protein HYZ65_15220 [Burkholderiales bacterium]|nr:hypothetical protein [Burkholderiales bacterium]